MKYYEKRGRGLKTPLPKWLLRSSLSTQIEAVLMLILGSIKWP
jgi:hypothetical protein